MRARRADDGPPAIFADDTFGCRHWVKARDTYLLAAGEHRLIVYNREADTRGDCVVIAPAQ